MPDMVIDWDEWYPVYDLEEPRPEGQYQNGVRVSVPAALVTRYRDAETRWLAVQAELRAMVQERERL